GVGGAMGGLGGVDAVGHRIVHGGREFVEPVRLDAEVEARLRALTDLAPLHQPKSLAAVAAVSEALPSIPAVACFDTAFHASMPEAAATYALPSEWRSRWAPAAVRVPWAIPRLCLAAGCGDDRPLAPGAS